MITAEQFITAIRGEDDEYTRALLTARFSAADFLNALHIFFDAEEDLGSDVSKEGFQEWLEVNEDDYERGMEFIGAMVLAAIRDPACQEWWQRNYGIDLIDYLTKFAEKLEDE